MTKAEEYRDEGFCATFIASSEKEEALRELCDLAASKMEEAVGSGVIFEKVRRRELAGSTGIGDGVAIPHIMIGENKRLITVLGVSKKGVEFYAPDGKPVMFILLTIGNKEKRGDLLRGLARAARIVKNEIFRQEAKEAVDSFALRTLFFSYEAKPTR